MVFMYLILYLTTVTWLVAALLYSDGYIVHSKTEVIFAPLLGVFVVAHAGFRWGHNQYERRLYR